MLVTLNNLGAHGNWYALNGVSLVHRYELPAYKGELIHTVKIPASLVCPPNHRVVVQEQRLGIKLSDCMWETLSKQIS